MTEARIERQDKTEGPDLSPARAEAVSGFENFNQIRTEMTSPIKASWLPNLEITGGSDSSLVTKTDDRSSTPASTEGVTGALDRSRRDVTDAADRHIADPKARESFRGNLDTFERRAREAGLPESEITRTYENIGRLLNAAESAVSPADRVLAARGLAHHLASPGDINQGNNNTCSVMTIGERYMRRNPSVASDIVASAAIAGNWRAPNGDGTFKDIRLHPSAFTPSDTEREFPPSDKERTFATRLMNHVIINDMYQRIGRFYGQDTPSDPKDPTSAGVSTGMQLGPSGEWEITRFREQKPFDGMWISREMMEDSIKRITGDENVVFGHHNRESENDLKLRLEEAQRTGNFPLIMKVDPTHPAFGNQGSGAPYHWASITGFDSATGRVQVSNQYGSEFDREVTLAELQRARRPRIPDAN